MSQETWQVTIEVTGNDALSALLKEDQIRVVGDIVNTTNRKSTVQNGAAVHSTAEASTNKRPASPSGEPGFAFNSKNANTAKQKTTIVGSIKKGRLEIGQMRADFRKAGFSDSQFDPMLQSLRAGKFIAGTGRGRYKVTAAGLNGAT
jgi:hypothetical protein